jgi:RHS repeat-associated protein
MAMPNRKIVGGQTYRYGYQGEFAETDPETGKPAFQLRLYDPRLNRWLSPDPMGQYDSPYMAMGNSWTNVVDPDGGCDDGKGNMTPCPDDGTGMPHQLNEVSLGSVKSNFRNYHPTMNIDQLIGMQNGVRNAGSEFLHHEVTMSVMALIAAPFAWEAMAFAAPYVATEASLIYGSRHVIGETLVTGSTTGMGARMSLDFSTELLVRDYDITRVNFLGIALSSIDGSLISEGIAAKYSLTIHGGWRVYGLKDTGTNFIIGRALGGVMPSSSLKNYFGSDSPALYFGVFSVQSVIKSSANSIFNE